jgi:hypothetical protein
MARHRASIYNKKCRNPNCFNLVIRRDKRTKYCKVCKWAYDKGYYHAYKSKRKMREEDEKYNNT